MANVSIVSLNVRGLRDNNKRCEMFKFFKREKFDIICIQETHSQKEDEWLWKKQWGEKNEIIFSHGENNSKGVSILINRNKYIQVTQRLQDNEGRYCIAEIGYKNKQFVLVNIYGPNEDRPEFFISLFELIQKYKSTELMIMGDFNMVLNAQLDRMDGKQYSPKSLTVLKEIMESFELADIWRLCNPNEKTYSWFRRKSYNRGISASRLDFALTSYSLNPFVDKITYEYGYKSDHSLLKMLLNVGDNVRGHGYWKFNNTLLHDIQYVNQVNEKIENCCIKYRDANPLEKWEGCQVEIVQLTKKYSINKAKRNKEKYNALLTRLDIVKKQIDKADSSYLAEYQILNKELENIIESKTAGSAFRSKVRYVQEYERNSKFFFALEKGRYNQKVMNALYLSDGKQLTHDSKVILELQNKFYGELYKADPKVKFGITDIPGPKVTLEDRQDLDLPITMEEVDKVWT